MGGRGRGRGEGYGVLNVRRKMMFCRNEGDDRPSRYAKLRCAKMSREVGCQRRRIFKGGRRRDYEGYVGGEEEIGAGEEMHRWGGDEGVGAGEVGVENGFRGEWVLYTRIVDREIEYI